MAMLKIAPVVALAVVMAALMAATVACGWWPGGASEPASYDDREDRGAAAGSDARDTATRFDLATRLAAARATVQPTLPSPDDGPTPDANAASGGAAQPTLPRWGNWPAPAAGRGQPTLMPAPAANAASREEYAACLDQIGLLTAVNDNELEHFIGAYRCRQMEPAPPQRWNPRCVQDAAEGYRERYGAEGSYDSHNIAYWYGLVACVPDYVPDPRQGDGGGNAYAACLDQVALLLSNHRAGDAVIAVGPYRCRHLEPAAPQRWNPRCVHDETQWYQERYQSGGAYDVDAIALWYGLAACVPAPTPGAGGEPRRGFAACLDEIALLMAGEWSNEVSFAIGPYRCRHLEPPAPQRWNPRCVHDEREWYRERYANDNYSVDGPANWYGLAVCAPGYAP